MNNKIIERIKQYLYDSGVPKTVFCRKLGISTTYLYKLLTGERLFSDNVYGIIDEYLTERNY